jgi:hypothetical protein
MAPNVIDYLAAYLAQQEEKASRRRNAPSATTNERKAAKKERMKTMLKELITAQPQPVDYLAFGD